MKNLIYLFFIFIYFIQAAESLRKEKSFSLFNVVKFRNSQCTSTAAASQAGVCYTSQECSDLGGSAQGNCAASFGVCCIITVSTCGGTVTQNCTYIENANFPQAVTGVAACTYMMTRCSSDICQVRLDFQNPTVLAQPVAANGLCNAENLVIVGGKAQTSLSINPPVLCGLLSGQHIYLDAGSASTVATLNFALAAATTAMWRIKTSQIECSAAWRAPQGCLQYFTGGTGTVQSFNFDGLCTQVACASGAFLQEQSYQVCFRQEKGMCEISLNETPLAMGVSFLLGDPVNGVAPGSQCSVGLCIINVAAGPPVVNQGSYIWMDNIPGDVNPANECAGVFCGTNLSDLQGKVTTTPGTVMSNKIPFIMRVQTEGVQTMLAGFSLDYSQTPC